MVARLDPTQQVVNYTDVELIALITADLNGRTDSSNMHSAISSPQTPYSSRRS